MLTWCRGMQDCFRLHPEMYGSELEDDEDELEDEIRARESAAAAGDEPSKPTREPTSQVADKAATPEEEKPAVVEATKEKKPAEEPHHDSSKVTLESVPTSQSGDEGVELVPKAAHDATSSN